VEQNLTNLLKSRSHLIYVSFTDFPEIKVALGNAIHSATGEAPFFTVFGHHMFLNGANYKLARKLRSLCDHEMSGTKTVDKLRVIQQQVRKNLETAYERFRHRTRTFNLSGVCSCPSRISNPCFDL